MTEMNNEENSGNPLDDQNNNSTHADSYELFDKTVEGSINHDTSSYEGLNTPDDNPEFYEDYYEGASDENLKKLEKFKIKNLDDSDESAKFLAATMGVAGTIRENARLINNVKTMRRQMFMSLLVNVAFIMLIIAMLSAFAAYPKTRYIPTTNNQAICEVTPENNPNITDVAIVDFAKDAVLNLYTFDYVNYEAQINNSLSRWFTPRGRIETVGAMNQAGILDFVKDNALTLRSGTTSTARIERKGRTSDGEPYWVVKFPMVVDIFSGGKNPEDRQNYDVTVRISASTGSAQNPKGLAVASAALEPVE